MFTVAIDLVLWQLLIVEQLYTLLFTVCLHGQRGQRRNGFIDAGGHKKGERAWSGEFNHRLFCYEGNVTTPATCS